MVVKFIDLDMALEIASSDGSMGGSEAFLCRQTGKIHYSDSELDNPEEALPDDIGDTTKYIAIPTKRDLDLGTPLVFEFVRAFMPDDYDHVRSIFSRRGAYGQFKNFLARERMLDRWHDFESKAQERALREWCADNGIEVED
ncbi:hypothetical protein FHP25_30330 [Vineibacter terrae]|uniref:Uncharacterized protein n=1 Tax=Vineibacter terrae TaxID=2586908 RepID=A0A5C8PC68_9HYPH|nr:hypothetical protein [Vineibacter terrae]TXL71388.1 hypothetical protein FHP25_30330 [Vineibacter terrae]